MKVVLGSDHGGYETKLVAIEYLKDVVCSEAHLILEFSQTGGLLNASSI